MVSFTPTELTDKQKGRFWNKVDKNGPVAREDLGPCWMWTAACSHDGEYGVLTCGGGGNSYAHRVSWVIANGPIPEGLFVLHHCDNKPCVRPDHLFIGTRKDNMKDKMGKGRWGGGRPKQQKTVEEVLDIRWSNLRGESYRELSERFGLTWQAIGLIVSGKSYPKVPMPLGPKVKRHSNKKA